MMQYIILEQVSTCNIHSLTTHIYDVYHADTSINMQYLFPRFTYMNWSLSVNVAFPSLPSTNDIHAHLPSEHNVLWDYSF